MRQTLDRAEKFLNLVALLAALLCAVAVALAARTFAARHLDGCALLRVLGQSQRSLTVSYTFEFVTAGLLASALGVLLGWLLHHVFIWVLAGLVDTALPPASGYPVALGLGMGLTLLLAFGLPPVLQLAQVPPLRVIRRDVGALRPAAAGVMVLGLLGFAVALLLASSDVKLGLITVGGFALAAVLFAGGGWLAADPRPAYAVAYSAEADAQLAWITPRITLPLRERIETALALGPAPNPYRRIKPLGAGRSRLAVQDWRVLFTHEGLRVTVLRIESGYKVSQLAEELPDPEGTLALHRAFRAGWPAA
jgi:hypothetical protein